MGDDATERPGDPYRRPRILDSAEFTLSVDIIDDARAPYRARVNGKAGACARTALEAIRRALLGAEEYSIADARHVHDEYDLRDEDPEPTEQYDRYEHSDHLYEAAFDAIDDIVGRWGLSPEEAEAFLERTGYFYTIEE